MLLIPPSIFRLLGDRFKWAGVVSAKGTRLVVADACGEDGAGSENTGCAGRRGTERGGRTDSGRDEGGLFSASEDWGDDDVVASLCETDTRKGVAACDSLRALLLPGCLTRAGVGVEGVVEPSSSSSGGSGVPSMGW